MGPHWQTTIDLGDGLVQRMLLPVALTEMAQVSGMGWQRSCNRSFPCPQDPMTETRSRR